jgi:hypothetical protein
MDFKKQLETLFENNQTEEFIHNYTGILPEININSCSITIIFDKDKILYITIVKILHDLNNIRISGTFCDKKRKGYSCSTGPIENYRNDVLIPFLEEYSDYFRRGYILK